MRSTFWWPQHSAQVATGSAVNFFDTLRLHLSSCCTNLVGSSCCNLTYVTDLEIKVGGEGCVTPPERMPNSKHDCHCTLPRQAEQA